MHRQTSIHNLCHFEYQCIVSPIWLCLVLIACRPQCVMDIPWLAAWENGAHGCTMTQAMWTHVSLKNGPLFVHKKNLMHQVRVTHIYASENQAIIGSDNCLLSLPEPVMVYCHWTNWKFKKKNHSRKCIRKCHPQNGDNFVSVSMYRRLAGLQIIDHVW